MAVGTEAGVGIQHAVVIFEHYAGEVFDVDLVDDAGIRRHGLEVLQRFLTPAEEGVALLVTLEFDLGIQVERVLGAVVVDHHRVVDNQFDRTQGIHLGGIAAELGDGIAHGGQIHHAGNASEVLQNHARRGEVDVLVGQLLQVGTRQRRDGVFGDVHAVFVAQQIFEQHLVGVGQTGHLVLRFELGQVEVGVRLGSDF